MCTPFTSPNIAGAKVEGEGLGETQAHGKEREKFYLEKFNGRENLLDQAQPGVKH
jgi:hypothetical protein